MKADKKHVTSTFTCHDMHINVRSLHMFTAVRLYVKQRRSAQTHKMRPCDFATLKRGGLGCPPTNETTMMCIHVRMQTVANELHRIDHRMCVVVAYVIQRRRSFEEGVFLVNVAGDRRWHALLRLRHRLDFRHHHLPLPLPPWWRLINSRRRRRRGRRALQFLQQPFRGRCTRRVWRLARRSRRPYS